MCRRRRGRVASREVTLGLVGRESVEVLRGLAPGEVVLAPGTPVGTRVRVEGGAMNLAWKDIRRQKLRFLLTGLGLGLLFSIVLAMGGIYRGMVADATMLIDAVGADLWVVQRDTRGPFAERSTVPRSLEDRLRVVEGVASAENFTYATMQRGDLDHPVRIGLVGLSWPSRPRSGSPAHLRSRLSTAHERSSSIGPSGQSLGATMPLGDDNYRSSGSRRVRLVGR
jgi:putative ABC transport system permease protein